MTANPCAKQLEFFDRCERSPVFRLHADIDTMLSVADIKRDMLPEMVMCGWWSGLGPPFEYGQESGWRDVEQATRVASALRDDDSGLPPLPAILNAAMPGVALAAVLNWCVDADHDRGRESERDADRAKPQRLTPVEIAILEVLAEAGPLMTRTKIWEHQKVRPGARDIKTVRKAVNWLLKSGYIEQPREKGKGLQITADGRCYLRQFPPADSR